MQATHSFLTHRSDDWRESLHSSLRFLRESWTTQWVGLPFVVDACAEFLHLNVTTQTPITAKLLTVTRELAERIEAGRYSRTPHEEPRYHNRLHFADVLTIITLQIAIENAHWGLKDAQWSAALLLIAMAHDLEHPGRVNHYPAEIEQRSVEALRPYLQKHVVPEPWVTSIENVILASDFSLVSQNHQRVAGQAFAWNTDWAIVLLNEADVMASVLEEFGYELGFALAGEWEQASLPLHSTVATDQGRLDFLASTLFSSYSANELGAPVDRRKQIAGDRK